MTSYVADTHGLIWYFTGATRLGVGAKRAFKEVKNGPALLFIPVIVLAELIFVSQGKRVDLDVKSILEVLQASPQIQILDISLERVLDLQTLTAIPEMHNRLIVAEAIAYNATLITKDTAIVNAKVVQTIW